MANHCADLLATKTNLQITLPKSLQIESRVRKWLETRAAQIQLDILKSSSIYKTKDIYHHVGDQFIIANDTATVLAQLGAGSYGAVYLIQLRSRPNELFAAKLFYDEPGFLDVTYFHSTYQDYPQIILLDKIKYIMVYEYKEGIPVHDIEAYGKEFGFTADQISLVKSRFEALTFSDAGPHNVIYRPTHDDFIQIDPN